jgi:hypothetical protein
MIAESHSFGASFIGLVALVIFLAVVWKGMRE